MSTAITEATTTKKQLTVVDITIIFTAIKDQYCEEVAKEVTEKLLKSLA